MPKTSLSTKRRKILDSWGVPIPYSQLRYKHPIEKGIYWYYFSLYVRERDVKKYGTCISCEKPITVDTCQAGHFIAAAGCGRDLLFHELNVNAECPRCNGLDPNHLLGYEQGLITRYGKKTPDMLKSMYFQYKNGPPLKDFKASEYAERIRALPSFTGKT